MDGKDFYRTGLFILDISNFEEENLPDSTQRARRQTSKTKVTKLATKKKTED